MQETKSECNIFVPERKRKQWFMDVSKDKSHAAKPVYIMTPQAFTCFDIYRQLSPTTEESIIMFLVTLNRNSSSGSSESVTP